MSLPLCSYYTIKSAKIQDLYRLLAGGILHISRRNVYGRTKLDSVIKQANMA